jgi:predicted lipoprotein with Yx(FWY)xxD motif
MTEIFGHRRALPLLAVGIAALLAGCGGSSSGGTSSGGTGSGGTSSSGTSTGSNAGASSGGYGAYGSSSSSSSSATQSSAGGGATVKLVDTSRGKLLANSRSFTLYLFTADHRNSDRCVSVSGCATTWPPLTMSGRPTAGTGVNKALLGTIKLPNGQHQVTYAGHPLYRYAADATPASTSYIGATSFGGTWLAVNAAGTAVH